MSKAQMLNVHMHSMPISMQNNVLLQTMRLTQI